MKKFFGMMLALAMMFSMVACGGTTEPTEIPTDAPTTAPTEGMIENPTEEVIDGNDAVVDASYLELLLNGVIAEQPVEFMGGVMPVDLADPDSVKYMTGLDSVDGITEAAVFEPMMGSIAFSMVMVRIAEGTEAKTIAEAMKNGIDTRKWICVEADDLQVVSCGDVVMLIMVETTNGMASQPFVDAFAQVCGGEVTVY